MLSSVKLLNGFKLHNFIEMFHIKKIGNLFLENYLLYLLILYTNLTYCWSVIHIYHNVQMISITQSL